MTDTPQSLDPEIKRQLDAFSSSAIPTAPPVSLDPEIKRQLDAFSSSAPVPKLDPEIKRQLDAFSSSAAAPAISTAATTEETPTVWGRIKNMFVGSDTALTQQTPEGFYSSLKDPFLGFNVIQGSLTEKAIKVFNPAYHGAVTREQADARAKLMQSPPVVNLVNAMTKADQEKHPVLAGTADIVSGLSTPSSVATLAGSGGLGLLEGPAKVLVPRLISAGFGANAIYSAIRETPEIQRALKEGRISDAERIITHVAWNVGMAALAARHAIAGKPIVGKTGAETTAATPGVEVKNALPTSAVSELVGHQTVPEARIVESEPAKTEILNSEFAKPKVGEAQPLRLFHGTSGEVIDVRELVSGERPGTLGKGVYFSTSPEISSHYGTPENVPIGGRVIAGELAPDIKLLDADAPLSEKLLATLEEKFGKTGDVNRNTYRGFLTSTEGDTAGINDLQKTIAKEGYLGILSEDVHGSPGVMLFEDAAKNLKPILPTMKVVAENHLPIITKSEVLAQNIQTIINNSGELAKMGLDVSKIKSPQDITQMLDSAADCIVRNTDPRATTVIGFELQKQLAQELDMTVEELLSRKSGTAFSAEQCLAARALMHDSGIGLLNLTPFAATGDEALQTKFLDGLARHQMIIDNVQGVKAELGRAVGSFRIPEAELPAVRAVNALAGLDRAVQLKAAELLAKIDSNDSRQVNSFIQQIKPSSTPDKIFEYYRNALLSSPKTLIVKGASEACMIALETASKALRGQLESAKESLTGKSAEAFSSEAYFYGKGVLRGLFHWKDILNGSLKLEDSPDFERVRTQAIKGRFGKVLRYPSELLSKQTNLMYALNYFGELESQAARAAIKEGLSGQDLYARQQYLVNNPTPEITAAANQTGLHNTFQTELGAFGKSVQSTINKAPVDIGKFLIPFFKTPVNLVKASGEVSPYGILKGLTRGDTSLVARGVIGTALASGVAALVLDGKISGGGPIDYKKRQTLQATGWQPYSIRIGNRWYRYHRAEPLGLLFGLTADAMHGLASGDDPEVVSSKYDNVISHIMRTVDDLPFLSTVSNVVESLHGDPETKVARFLQNEVAGFVPAGLANIAEGIDRTVRKPTSISEAIETRAPGLTGNVAPLIDITGQPVQRPASALGGINPFPVSLDRKNPVTQELARLGVTVEDLPQPKTRRTATGERVSIGTPPSPAEALILQQQETQKFYELIGRSIQNPRWQLIPDPEKKLVISALHKEVVAGRLARLRVIRQQLQ